MFQSINRGKNAAVKSIFLPGTLFFLCLSATTANSRVLADESASQPQLNGRVDMVDNLSPQQPTNTKRLNRKAIVRSTNQNQLQAQTPVVQQQKIYRNSKGQVAKDNLPPNFLSGSVSIGEQFPDLASQRPASGSFAPQQTTPPAPPVKKPYIWQMSRDGGYYDASGQIKGTVPGNELWRYGGVMGDEVTPVPKGPSVQMNSAGHIKWHPAWMNK